MISVKHSRLDGLGDGADLVDLQQQAVASLLLTGLLDALGVGDGQIVSHHLDIHCPRELSPVLPVILIERILDGLD